MPERSPLVGTALLLLGLLLAAAGWLGGSPAIAGTLLAQTPMALGLGLLRGSRHQAGTLGDAGRLTLYWASCALATCVLLGWPLARLLAQPSLGHSLLLSAAAGGLLIGLWWQWPSLHVLERRGGSASARFAERSALEASAWRGLLQVAVPATVLLVGGLLLAWPGLLIGTPRIATCTVFVLLLPLVHWLLQTAAPAPELYGLPVLEMPGDEQADTNVIDITPLPTAVNASPDPAGLARELYTATRNGRVERALELLEAGADPHAAPDTDSRDRRSLPMLAALLPDLRLLRALIERGADVNATQAGMSPLLVATRDSWHGRPEAVMTLLANGADPRQTDAEGNTPLHHAARSADPGVAALLRDAGADLDAPNHDGISPLGSACAVGNWRLARFLLERGAKPEPVGGQPALLRAAACEDDDPAGVQLLLRHKAKPNACDGQGRSALHEAAAAGHADICTALLAAGADPNARDSEGRTPLLDAIRSDNNTPALTVLLAAKADPLACDGNGANALHLLCTAETPALDCAAQLLALRVDPHAPDARGRSAIDLATAAGRWMLLAVLDPKRALPVSLQHDDHILSDRPPQLLLRERLLEGGTPQQLSALAALLEPADFDALLHDAEVIAIPGQLQWLLQHGANPEHRQPGGITPVQTALAQGEAGIAHLQILFAAGASPAGTSNLACFLSACHHGTPGPDAEAFALDLLLRGADPFAPSAQAESVLVLAVRMGWQRLLLQLLAMGLDPDACDTRGMTALHFAAAQGRADLIKPLILTGAAPDRRAADGQTPLGIALSCGRRDLADWLDWRGWRLPHRPLLAADVPAAAIVGDLDAVRRLLALGLAVNATDSQGCTALLRASGGGHRALVDFLLTQGANPGIAAITGATALSAAVSMRHVDIVDRLLQAGCNLEQRLPGDMTVLLLASALGLPDLVARLLQAGSDLHAMDAQGQTALHRAALYGFTARDRSRLMALLDTLLLAGANPQQRVDTGLTPLLLLLGARAEPGTPADESVLLAAVERLLDEDVTLDDRDARGYTPLHLAALHGLQRVAKALLQLGADPTLRDTLNRTPREVAQMRGYMDVAAELDVNPATAAASNVSMARFLRE